MIDPNVDTEASAAAGQSSASPDGRKAWRERNQLAVVDALLDLYAEGNLRPDANTVAERSAVSRRSVFRYFNDRDDLDRTAIARQQDRVRHLLEIPAIGEGPLDERIARIAGQRVTLFDKVQWAARVSRLRAPFHAIIAGELRQSRRFLARQVERHFAPEFAAMSEPERGETLAAADALASFEAFDLMTSRGLGSANVRAAVERGLTALFGCGKTG